MDVILPQWETAKHSTVHKSAGFRESSNEPEKKWRQTIAENIVHHHPPTDGGTGKP